MNRCDFLMNVTDTPSMVKYESEYGLRFQRIKSKINSID